MQAARLALPVNFRAYRERRAVPSDRDPISLPVPSWRSPAAVAADGNAPAFARASALTYLAPSLSLTRSFPCGLGRSARRCDFSVKIEDAGTLYPKRMETVDDEIRDLSFKFMDKAKADGKPFFVWLNPTRMHIVTHLSPKYEAMRNSKNGWTIHEAGMAQLDDDVGLVMQKLKDMGAEDNTIVVFTTDNGTELFTWPDGGQTPFAQSKGTVLEGGFRVPAIIRWPGKVPAGKVENGIISGLDWFPTFLAAAGDPNIGEELKQGKKLGDTTYKVHLDGYNQMDLITGQGAFEPARDLVLRRKRAWCRTHR